MKTYRIQFSISGVGVRNQIEYDLEIKVIKQRHSELNGPNCQ